MADDMTKYFIFRDTRLKGNLPALATALITSQVDESTSLSTAFVRINLAARVYGKLKTLFILCHGSGSGIGNTSDIWWRGGTGLELGKEGVTAVNVSAWAAIKDCVEHIVVYSCGAAYTGPAMPDPRITYDGQSLMKSLAKYTNAIVYAADKIQWYSSKDFNLGKWEGTVYMFFPTGHVVPDFRPPTEVIDVISPLSEPSRFSLSYLNYLVQKQMRNR